MGSFELDSETIGTIRVVPLGHQLTLTETLLPLLGDAAPLVSRHDWEVGRLVLAPQFRSDVDALRRCLYLSLAYARANARVDMLYATCTHVLARLYRRFGFSILARDVPLPGTSKTYTLIHGESGVVLDSLAAQGGPARPQ